VIDLIFTQKSKYTRYTKTGSSSRLKTVIFSFKSFEPSQPSAEDACMIIKILSSAINHFDNLKYPVRRSGYLLFTQKSRYSTKKKNNCWWWFFSKVFYLTYSGPFVKPLHCERDRYAIKSIPNLHMASFTPSREF